MPLLTEEQKETYGELLCTICAIETPSGHKKNLDKMADVLTRFAAARGYDVERFPMENTGDFLLIKLHAAASGQPVLFMAHMDTVHREGVFGKEPVTRNGDWLFGPGVMDCKGGIVTGLCAMELLQKSALLRPVYLLLTSDEEVSGRLSGQQGLEIIQKTAKASCAAFNLEPGKPGEITVARKGILRMSVGVTGVAAHAGNAYFEGASAIQEAAHVVLETEGMSRRDGITFNCGIIEGGSTASTVPDSCTVTVDIRVSDSEEMETARALMHDLTRKCVIPNTARRVSLISERPPMALADLNLSLLKQWNASAAALGLPAFRGIRRGGGSDAAYTVLAGVPTLCSCGMVGYGEHTLREKVDLSTLGERAALLCHTVLSL